MKDIWIPLVGTFLAVSITCSILSAIFYVHGWAWKAPLLAIIFAGVVYFTLGLAFWIMDVLETKDK
jgi:hypothetical protein